MESLGKIRGAVALDVGCGTGANPPLLVPRAGSSGVIAGIDYSEGMLTKAHEKVPRCDWKNYRAGTVTTRLYLRL